MTAGRSLSGNSRGLAGTAGQAAFRPRCLTAASAPTVADAARMLASPAASATGGRQSPAAGAMRTAASFLLDRIRSEMLMVVGYAAAIAD